MKYSPGRSFPGLVAGIPIGCSAGLAPIPADAQQVHITDTDTSLRLEPATVRAGDVYVVLDARRQNVVIVAEADGRGDTRPDERRRPCPASTW